PPACRGGGRRLRSEPYPSLLALPLLVARVRTDDHHHAMAADGLALIAHLLHGRTNLHRNLEPTRSGRRSAVPVDDPAPREVVRRELHEHPVTRQDPDVVHPHLAGDVGEDLVTVVELDAEHRVRERLDHRSLDLNRVLLGHTPPGSPYPEHAKMPRGAPRSYREYTPAADRTSPSRFAP